MKILQINSKKLTIKFLALLSLDLLTIYKGWQGLEAK